MVDVSQKADTERVAIAEGFISMHEETLAMIAGGTAKKGDVLACARVAGIMAREAHERPHPHVPPAQHHESEGGVRARVRRRAR